MDHTQEPLVGCRASPSSDPVSGSEYELSEGTSGAESDALSDEDPDDDEEEEEDEDDGEYNDNIDNTDGDNEGSDAAEDQPNPAQTQRDIFTQPVPADWEPTNPFQEQFLMFIQSIHTHCNTEAVMEAVLRKVVADQPIHQGAWQTLKNTTPEVFACAIMQFVPDHVHEILSLTPEEHTLERIQQLPRVTRSDEKSWGAYLHIVEDNIRQQRRARQRKRPDSRTDRPKYLYATNARGLGTRKPISR